MNSNRKIRLVHETRLFSWISNLQWKGSILTMSHAVTPAPLPLVTPRSHDKLLLRTPTAIYHSQSAWVRENSDPLSQLMLLTPFAVVTRRVLCVFWEASSKANIYRLPRSSDVSKVVGSRPNVHFETFSPFLLDFHVPKRLEWYKSDFPFLVFPLRSLPPVAL